MKHLFRLPELLLFLPLAAMLWWGHSSIDIHLADTYFVIGNAGYAAITLLLPLLFTSWIIHVLLRRRGRMAGKWRRAQMGVTLLCAAVAAVIITYLPGAAPPGYYDVNTSYSFITLYKMLLACVVIFLLCQLAFWITGTVLLMKKH